MAGEVRAELAEIDALIRASADERTAVGPLFDGLFRRLRAELTEARASGYHSATEPGPNVDSMKIFLDDIWFYAHIEKDGLPPSRGLHRRPPSDSGDGEGMA
jgi:hypothetical protein